MSSDPVVRPTAWRLMLAALSVWAANFLVGYAVALVFPGQSWVRWSIAILFVASIPSLLAIDRIGQRRPQADLVRSAVWVAAIGTAFNATVAAF